MGAHFPRPRHPAGATRLRRRLPWAGLLAALLLLFGDMGQAEPTGALRLRLDVTPPASPAPLPAAGAAASAAGPASSAVRAALARARQEMVHGQAPQAIRRIAEVLDAAQAQELAEAAGLLVIAGDSHRALEAYGRLLAMARPMPDVGWLGLAIALEDQGHTRAAYAAYQRAAQALGEAPLRAFIAARLQRLATEALDNGVQDRAAPGLQ